MIVYACVRMCRYGCRQCTKDQNSDMNSKPVSLNILVSHITKRNRPEMEELPYRILADDKDLENTATVTMYSNVFVFGKI